MDWSREGNSFMEYFQKQLEDPDGLKMDFEKYKKRFGKDFTIHDYMELLKAYAITEHARVLGNLPELLSHHLYLMPDKTISVRVES